MSKITTMTKTKKAILTAATFLTMIQFGSSNNVHTLPRTDKSRIHLESVQGTGRFYPITYSEGIEDLEKLAEKKEKEDAFVYLPNTGWIDVGFRVNNDKYRTNIDINLVNVVPRGYKYTI
ncbi:hypothetical protein JXA48_03140, partial [Candidatus Woesearchaeota archaeon]|nr:hypothetical protein [Candidatus Woesearchaeota archaeon]